MKAILIVSHEYHANQPSVFAIINGHYYGCQIYPQHRNFPAAQYWTGATSSDSDRGFTIKEVEYTEINFEQIKNLQSVIFGLEKLIPEQPNFPYVSKNWTIRRGKKYEAYMKETEARAKAISDYFESIKIFDTAKSKARKDLRNVLLNKA